MEGVFNQVQGVNKIPLWEVTLNFRSKETGGIYQQSNCGESLLQTKGNSIHEGLKRHSVWETESSLV